LAAEDRCHLNGLAMKDGRAAYVTAVSSSDVVDGWRDHRAGGGIVIDVNSNEIVIGGLSMPHSPRWYQGRLWLLNSGTGEFGYVDVDAGRFVPVSFCAGYLRGLAFHGDFAPGNHDPDSVGGAGDARLTSGSPYQIVRKSQEEVLMSTATMTSKGQITIPAIVRTALGVQAGDRVEFVEVEAGRFELVAATQSVTALKGLVQKPATPVTVEAMNEAIAARGAKAR
jgi:AbrB family looped-hinge helix DNA binding protein